MQGFGGLERENHINAIVSAPRPSYPENRKLPGSLRELPRALESFRKPPRAALESFRELPLRASLLREGIQPRLLGSMLFQLLLRSPLLDVHLPLPPRLLEGRVSIAVALVFQRAHEIIGLLRVARIFGDVLLHALEEDLGRLR